MVNILEYY